LRAGFHDIVVFVARGCGGVPLTTQDSFTAARIDDMAFVLDHIWRNRNKKLLSASSLVQSEGEKPQIYGIGYSLGAGLLLNYLGADDSKRVNRLSGALAISPAWNFHTQTKHFSKWSQHVLVRGLQMYVRQNLKYIRKLQGTGQSATANFDVEGLLSAKNVKEFDYHAIVGMRQLHGFETVDDYYTASSAIHISHKIVTPTLALSSDNDPVCAARGCPEEGELGEGLVIARTKRGGHVAFPSSSSREHSPFSYLLNFIGFGTASWVDELAVEWFENLIRTSCKNPQSVVNVSYHNKENKTACPLSSQLITAYQQANYVVFTHTLPLPNISSSPSFPSPLPAQLHFQVNVSSPLMLHLMKMHRVHTAAFITGYNPRSVLTSKIINDQQQQKLREWARGGGWHWGEGVSTDSTEQWPDEPSLIVLGVKEEEARRAGKNFGQNAIVWFVIEEIDTDEEEGKLKLNVIPRLLMLQ